MSRPEIIVYRDFNGDISVSLDGGATSTYLTDGYRNCLTPVPDGYYRLETGPILEFEREVWRSGDQS